MARPSNLGEEARKFLDEQAEQDRQTLDRILKGDSRYKFTGGGRSANNHRVKTMAYALREEARRATANERAAWEGIMLRIQPGMSIRRLARALGLDRVTVTNALQRTGLWDEFRARAAKENDDRDAPVRQQQQAMRSAGQGVLSSWTDVYWIPRLGRWAARPFEPAKRPKGYRKMVHLGYRRTDYAAHLLVIEWRKSKGIGDLG